MPAAVRKLIGDSVWTVIRLLWLMEGFWEGPEPWPASEKKPGTKTSSPP